MSEENCFTDICKCLILILDIEYAWNTNKIKIILKIL